MANNSGSHTRPSSAAERPDGLGTASDAAVQAACLAMTASLLSDCPARHSDSAASSSAKALDDEVRRITDAFIRKQPILSRAFARKLSETASFKRFVEVLAQPSAAWPRWMHFFAAHARHEGRQRYMSESL